jgi:hypothetical protein
MLAPGLLELVSPVIDTHGDFFRFSFGQPQRIETRIKQDSEIAASINPFDEQFQKIFQVSETGRAPRR